MPNEKAIRRPNNLYGVLLAYQTETSEKIFLSPKKNIFGRRKVFEKKSKKVEKSRKFSSTIGKSTFLRKQKTPKLEGDPFFKVTSAGSPVDYRTPIFGGVFGGGPFFFAVSRILKQGGDRVFQHANTAMIHRELALEARVNA